MFAADPPAQAPRPRRDLRLAAAARRTFSGPSGFLADPVHRRRVNEYLADMVRPYLLETPPDLPGAVLPEFPGQSYGEMAGELIDAVVPAGETVDLLVLAFSVHDVRPGRQTAAYLSHLTPGAPMAFAICDQGPAAVFSGLQVARAYAATAGVGRALVIAVEQAVLPYPCPAPLPAQHQGVAMLYTSSPGGARVIDVRQHAGVLPGEAASLAGGGLAELAGRRFPVTLVLGHALAGLWPDASSASAGRPRVRVTMTGQPSTALWWSVIDELAAGTRAGAAGAGLLVAADYDRDLRYLSMTAFAR